MKSAKSLFAVLLVAMLSGGAEHEGEGPSAVDRSEVDAVIGALYGAVSFNKGGEPDWPGLRSLFLEGAVLAQPRRGTQQLELLSVEEFVARFRADLASFEDRGTGFFERVAGSVCTTFGRTAHCRVVFEARFDPKSAAPVGRGVDDIQLVRNDGRWWIAAIATEYELPDRPIPGDLLAQAGVDDSARREPVAACSKLDFDPFELDEHGLIGRDGGKVAVSYEFCVPRDQELVDQVRAIDPSVAIHAGSPGRIGCGPEQVLCVGSTHQIGFLEVLAGLCDLEHIALIQRSDFE